MPSFVATALAVGEHEDAECFLVGLADNPHQPDHEFQLQESLQFDPQDAALGMDTPCIVLTDGVTYYGGIRSRVLQNSVLTIGLDEVAQSALGVDDVRIKLQLDDQQGSLLRGGLERLFKDDRSGPELLTPS